jgi:predicted component of type VI protein secretion system
MHEASSTVYPCDNGIPYLGMVVFKSHCRLKNRNARAFEARLRDWQNQVARGELDLETMTLRIQGWVAHAKHAQTQGLRLAILGKPLKLTHSNQTIRPTQKPSKPPKPPTP